MWCWKGAKPKIHSLHHSRTTTISRLFKWCWKGATPKICAFTTCTTRAPQKMDGIRRPKARFARPADVPQMRCSTTPLSQRCSAAPAFFPLKAGTQRRKAKALHPGVRQDGVCATWWRISSFGTGEARDSAAGIRYLTQNLICKNNFITILKV